MHARRLLGGHRHQERLLLFLGLVPLFLTQGRGGARRRRVRAPLLVEGARHLQHCAAHTREERRTERLAAAATALAAAGRLGTALGTALGTTRA
jgi:hypothetical protein